MSASSPPQPPQAPSPPQPIVSTTTTTATASPPAESNSHPHPRPHPPSSASTTFLTANSTTSATTNPTTPSSSTLPTSDSVTQARTAVVATLSNLLDRKLQTRATTLHENAASLTKQEREVEQATVGLRKEREKLEKEAAKAERSLREIGSVQNWAEVLERQFLVVEETVRLANGGKDGSEGGERSYSGSGSCSCSECGDERLDEAPLGSDYKGKGKEDVAMKDGTHDDVVMADHTEDEMQTGWSEASRSLMDAESSTGTGTGQAKGSETASLSTTS
ncbi:GCN5-like protein 1 (GCN5L1) domain-containing protein [Sarocladium implicatum]|nr:GCN5-like protein 1 (GCN5L1) domain-containing protein [Sarocladium implicatum]